jgi:hypothetical protein
VTFHTIRVVTPVNPDVVTVRDQETGDVIETFTRGLDRQWRNARGEVVEQRAGAWSIAEAWPSEGREP